MELWTKDHAITLLPALAAMILVALGMRFFLNRKSLEQRLIPFRILSIILVLLEIGKQVLSFRQGYDLYHIPLHFCSLFIFVLPFAAFYRGKHRSAVWAVTSALCASVTALMLIYPNLIYSAGNVQGFFSNYFDFHTVAFHNIVVLAFFLILALNLHTPGQKGENKAVVLFIIGFCAISATAAQLLETNFNNFYSCNIPILETVRTTVQTAVGYVPAQLMYVSIVASLNIVFVWVFYRGYCLLQKIFPAKETT